MREYGFYLSRIFPYKDKIVDSVLIREKAGQRTTIFSHIFYRVTSAIKIYTPYSIGTIIKGYRMYTDIAHFIKI